ncbi:MAG: DUF4337 domain-containing protein [Terriglobia bacterium]
MSEEVHELAEHAEHAAHDPSLAPVTVTMALLAVLVATVSLLGHRAHTEEILLQNKATDTWNEYQAKSIRRHGYEQFTDLLSISDFKNVEAAAKMKEKYSREIERYKDDQDKLQAEARSLEDEVGAEGRKANRFDLGEVCLEAALVITSMTIITRRRMFWYGGSVLAIVGLGLAATGFVVH